MSGHENIQNRPPEYEIIVLESQILRHVCHPVGKKTDSLVRLGVVEVGTRPLPSWPEEGFFLANIGKKNTPLLLELRFEQATNNIWIALLMTNEQSPKNLEVMSRRLLETVTEMGINFEAIIGLEALGSKLSQEMARLKGPYTPTTTFMKGKLMTTREGEYFVGPPKPWVKAEDYVSVESGTNVLSLQRLYADRRICKEFAGKSVIIVDDAHLTPGRGTMGTGVELAGKMGLNVVACLTVLNETGESQILGIPYCGLARIPTFQNTDGIIRPKEDNLAGVDLFYL